MIWDLSSDDRKLCRLECERQYATSPKQIEGMQKAYAQTKRFGFRFFLPPPEALVALELELARLIEPARAGYRAGPAVFPDGGSAAPAHEIHDRIWQWAQMMVGREGTLLERYQAYQYAHPHPDGNGRNGLCTWSIDVYWETWTWPTELPPVIFGSDRVSVKDQDYFDRLYLG